MITNQNLRSPREQQEQHGLVPNARDKRQSRARTGVVAPYPTRGEIVKRAAGAFYTPILFSPGTRRLVGLLKLLP